jgi:hypothetical protein
MDFAKRRLIIFKEDGVEQGGVEFPEERDENRSVTFILRPGTTRGPGPHWHEIKTGCVFPPPFHQKPVNSTTNSPFFVQVYDTI